MAALSTRPTPPWTCIWNVFQPFWSLSRASSEAGPEEANALEIYVERPDMRPLQDLLRVMEPERTIEKAIVVGQRGAGKSMDLAWLTHELGETHSVFWVDAVEEGREILQDPIGLFVAIALAVYEGARQIGCAPDRRLLEVFLSTCLDTITREEVSEEQIKLRLDKALKRLAGTVAQVSWPLALGTANPVFMITGGVAAGVQMLLDWVELSADEKDTLRSTRKSAPRADAAAVRLMNLVSAVETCCGHPILIVVDGLDRVEVEQVRTLFQRGQDLARPDVRLILTAPLILYATPEFEQLQDFFPHVILTPNAQIGGPNGSGQRFLHQVVQRRLEICGKTVEQVFEQGVLEILIDASGGNIRQLITLVREATLHSEAEGRAKVSETSAQIAINRVKAGLVAPLRGDQLKALKDFYLQDALKVPPSGELGDTLLRRKWVLAYVDERGFLRYALNPLVQDYLEEEGVL